MGCSKEKLVCKSHTHFHQHTLELGQEIFVLFFSRTFMFHMKYYCTLLCRHSQQSPNWRNCECELSCWCSAAVHIPVVVHWLCSLYNPVWDRPNLLEPTILCWVHWDWYSRGHCQCGTEGETELYYYTVSAVNGDVIVTVRRVFTTPQYSKCYAVIPVLFLYSISHYNH